MSQGVRFDVIIVGARCAGASLACFLARAGAKVLILDKDPLPSEQVISTHTIHPPGLDVLDEIGVGEEVRAFANPARVVRLQKDDPFVDFEIPEGRFECCPRRKRLDGLLQQSALDAGADLRDRVVLRDLLWNQDRVTGVRVVSGGTEYQASAPLVVGADGRHSTLARLVGAEEYYAYDAPRAMYWGYWPAPDFWKKDPAYPFDMYIGNIAGAVRVVFQTDNGRLLIGSLPPVRETIRWRGNPLKTLQADLARHPLLGRLVVDRQPDEPVRGTIKERYFFRRATGPGWVLVGDAGIHKEFILGDGITEALIQARSLAEVIAEGSEPALTTWWRQRDVDALPLYFFGQDEGADAGPNELQRTVFSRLSSVPSLKARLPLIFDRKCSPYEVFPFPWILRRTLSAAFTGKHRVIKDFLEMGKRGSQVKKEIETRKQLLNRTRGRT
jgi:menaquinone-9 beta-reductase